MTSNKLFSVLRNVLSVIVPVVMIISIFLLLIKQVDDKADNIDVLFCAIAFFTACIIGASVLCWLSTRQTIAHLSIAYIVLAILYIVHFYQLIQTTQQSYQGIHFLLLLPRYISILLLQYMAFRLSCYLFEKYFDKGL